MSASYNVLKTYSAAPILGYFSRLYAITSLQNHSLQNAPPPLHLTHNRWVGRTTLETGR